jgi:hypothetical protein
VAATAILDWICASKWLPTASLDCAAVPIANARDAEIARVVAGALARSGTETR